MFKLGSRVVAKRKGITYWGVVVAIRGKHRTVRYFHSVSKGYKKKMFRLAELSEDKRKGIV